MTKNKDNDAWGRRVYLEDIPPEPKGICKYCNCNQDYGNLDNCTGECIELPLSENEELNFE